MTGLAIQSFGYRVDSTCQWFSRHKGLRKKGMWLEFKENDKAGMKGEARRKTRTSL